MTQKPSTSPIINSLIVPCGMNCGLCRAYLREENSCPGCGSLERFRAKTRVNCKLRACRKRKSRFCFDCAEFPCDRLEHLDERYRAKYGMSEIANLKYIKKNGIKKFVEKENRKWVSKKGVKCCHDGKRYLRPGNVRR